MFDIILSMENNNNKRNLYNDGDSGKLYLFALVIPLVFGFILSLILNMIAVGLGLSAFTQSPALYSIYLLLVNGSLLAVYFVYNKITKTNYVNASLLKPKFSWKNLVFSILIALITLFGSLYLIKYITYLMETIGYNPDSSLPLPLSNAGWLVLNILILALAPAICEELIYRGVVFNGLRKFGKVGAIFISALLFALAHGSAMQFFYQFILGLVLAWIVVKTGSIVYSMVVHFVNNAIVVIDNYITIHTGFLEETKFTPLIIAIAFVAAAVAGGLLWLILHFTKEKKKENQISYNQIYNETYTKENRKFSSSSSILFFVLSLVVAVGLWAAGTFMA